MSESADQQHVALEAALAELRQMIVRDGVQHNFAEVLGRMIALFLPEGADHKAQVKGR